MNNGRIEISGETSVYGLVGNPVFHSLSPAFWNAAFSATGMNAVYVPFKTEKEGFQATLMALKSLNVKGVNVTMPFKKQAADCCDVLYSPADEIASVNTVKFNSQSIEGYNTDATGFYEIVKELRGNFTATILGNGSSAIAAFWALNKNKQVNSVNLVARNERELKIDARLNYKCLSWNEKNIQAAIRESKLIINATCLQQPDKIPGLIESLTESKIFVDFNYNGSLIKLITKIGCKAIDGRELLLNQGIKSFELLTGKPAPIQVIKKSIYHN